jgi:glycerol 3-phosphatase-1
MAAAALTLWHYMTKPRPTGIVSLRLHQIYTYTYTWSTSTYPAAKKTNTTPDVNHVEGQIPKKYGSDAVEIPGGRDLLSALETTNARWGVVTSGTRALIDGWLEVLGLTHPKMLVVAEDVPLGKPDPRCYLLGAKKLGLEESKSIVVLEDAPSGIKAGKAAGYKVIALSTTHSLEKLKEAGADWIVQDLRSLSVVSVEGGKVKIEIRDALQ